MTEIEALRKVVEIAGSQRALAEMLGVTQPTISCWLNRDKRIGALYAIPCDLFTRGEVSVHELRPDLYPANIVNVLIRDIPSVVSHSVANHRAEAG